MKSIRLLGITLSVATVLLNVNQALAANDTVTANPSNTQTSVNAILQLPDTTTNPAPPSPQDPSQGGTTNPDKPSNKSNNPQGTFGIAYQPDIFNFGTTKLIETGPQEIRALVPTNGFHVGVKDKTREKKPWTLTASLNGTITDIPGVSISIAGTSDIKENTVNGLIAAPSGAAIGLENIEISKTSGALPIMKGNAGIVHNSVYDYALGDVKLKLANAKNVAAGTYTGTVNWNLSVTP